MGIHHRSSGEAARELAAELGDAFSVRADRSLPEEVDALIAELKERAGHLDVLVNNAGYNGNAPMLAMKPDGYDAVAWLATRASYVNGSVIHVKGGLFGG